MLRINRYTVLIIACATFFLFMILRRISEDHPAVGTWATVFLLASIVAILLLLPYLYRKKLEQREPKNLRTFIMADPQLRELIKPKKPEPPDPSSPSAPSSSPPPTEK